MRRRWLLPCALVLLAPAAAPAKGIAWRGSLDAALEEARTKSAVVFVAVNMDREKANDRMLDVYREPVIQRLAERTVPLFCSRFEHAASGPCPRAGGVTCAEHMAVEKAVRGRYLKTAADGSVVAPEHVFLAPDGSVISSVAYEVGKDELEWCLAQAIAKVDPTFQAGDRGRPPRRLRVGAVAEPGESGSTAPPTKAEVEAILDRLKKGERPWELREEMALLMRSDEKKAREAIGNLLQSRYVDREGWLAVLLHSVGRTSPPSYHELIVPFVQDERENVRWEAIVALEQLREPKAAPALWKAWKKPKEGDRRELVRALAAVSPGDAKVHDLALEHARNAKDEDLRCAAIVAAVAAPREAALALAGETAKHEAPRVRAAGACLAGLLRATELVPALEEAALLEKDPATKGALEKALKVIRGADAAELEEAIGRATGSAIPRDRN